jgi:two-component system chemotaxis response regulator CheB
MTMVPDPRLQQVEAVVIGASACGFEALLAILRGLPASYPLPLVAVLHLPDHHESRLAELFGHRLSLDVREARDKEPLAPGILYFAPSGYHLSIEDDKDGDEVGAVRRFCYLGN